MSPLPPCANSIPPSGTPCWPVSSAGCVAGLRPRHGGERVRGGHGRSHLRAIPDVGGASAGHLNELSPAAVRGTLPGFAYQMGNLLAAITATAQTRLAQWRGGDFAFAMSVWMVLVALLLALLLWLGPEARGVGFGHGES